MERSKRFFEYRFQSCHFLKWELQKCIFMSVLILTPLYLFPKPGNAGIILNELTPRDSVKLNGEFSQDYPESKFGSAPSRVSIREDDGEVSKTRKIMDVFQKKNDIQTDVNIDLLKLSKIHGIAQEVAVIANDLGFFPKAIFVTVNIPVRLFAIGASQNPLCFMMDQFQIRKQIRSQKIEEMSFTPTSVGQFRYYCPINGMEGSLIVKELNETSIESRLKVGQKNADSEKKSSGE